MSTLHRLISLCKPSAPRRAAAPLPNVPAARSRPSVLIVEDHAEVASYLRRALEQLQATAEVSPEGETAVTMAELMHFDLIILDILLPGMNGFEVFRTIRQSPHLRDVPVIIVSAVTAPESQAEAARLGAAYYFCKPFELVDFQAQVKRVLRLGPAEPGSN